MSGLSGPRDPRYPIGRVNLRPALSFEERTALLAQLAELPALFRAALEGLSDEQLDAPYREGGWTRRQVAHHVPDSHLNAYVRTKLALTEDAPTIKPYDEAAWAELPDALLPIEPSLRLLSALHERWVTLLRGVPETAWSRTFIHPEAGRPYSLDELLQLYVWHGRHHLAHVRI